jgi:hypothetical protein
MKTSRRLRNVSHSNRCNFRLRRRRVTRARAHWWFVQMRRVVDDARGHEIAAPTEVNSTFSTFHVPQPMK